MKFNLSWLQTLFVFELFLVVASYMAIVCIALLVTGVYIERLDYAENITNFRM